MEAKIPKVVATAPERIYLTVSDSQFDAKQPFPDDHEGICWCEDEAVDVCVPYVRADLHAALQSRIDALTADAERYRWLRSRLDSVDFAYGEPARTVLAFAWPEGVRVGADLGRNIDAARQQEAARAPDTQDAG